MAEGKSWVKETARNVLLTAALTAGAAPTVQANAVDDGLHAAGLISDGEHAKRNAIEAAEKAEKAITSGAKAAGAEAQKLSGQALEEWNKPENVKAREEAAAKAADLAGEGAAKLQELGGDLLKSGGDWLKRAAESKAQANQPPQK